MAVGPLGMRHGELKPLPVATAWPTLPISQPKLKMSGFDENR
jgi:hypothetical protein